MSDDYSMLLLRVVKGEEPLGTAFWVTLILMSIYFSYEYYVPRFSDVFQGYFHFFDLFFLTYTMVSIHHCSHDTGLASRVAARFYVLALLAVACYLTFRYFGLLWAMGYPFIAITAGFVVKE